MSVDLYGLTPEERVLVHKNVQHELDNLNWFERNHAIIVIVVFIVFCVILLCLYLFDVLTLTTTLIIGGIFLPGFVWAVLSQKTESSLLLDEIEAVHMTPAYRDRTKF